MLRFIWHTWFKGHSVRTNRNVQTAPPGGGPGWLHRCECGEVWAR